MTDEEIVKRISQQLGIAVAFARMAKFVQDVHKARHLKMRAEEFTRHCLILIATHKQAVERWMQSRGSVIEDRP